MVNKHRNRKVLGGTWHRKLIRSSQAYTTCAPAASGWCCPCQSASRSPPGVGPCLCWSTCTTQSATSTCYSGTPRHTSCQCRRGWRRADCVNDGSCPRGPYPQPSCAGSLHVTAQAPVGAHQALLDRHQPVRVTAACRQLLAAGKRTSCSVFRRALWGPRARAGLGQLKREPTIRSRS